MFDDGQEESEYWDCIHCTARNHCNDIRCSQCLSLRTVLYPNIPDNLPVPEISNPYPEKKFTNFQESLSAAHTPKRKEQRPEQTSETGFPSSSVDPPSFPQPPEPGIKTTDSNSEQNAPSGSEINIEDMFPMPSTFANSGNSSLDSEADLYNEGSPQGGSTPGNGDATMNSDEFRLSPIQPLNDPDDPPLITGSPSNTDEPVDIENFRLPPLTGLPPVITTTTNSTVFSTARPVTTTTSSANIQSRMSSVDDFMEQSTFGFKKSDFESFEKAKQNNIGNTDLGGSVSSPLDLTTSRQIRTNALDVPERTAEQGNELGGAFLPFHSFPTENSLEPNQPEPRDDWSAPYNRMDKIGLGASNRSLHPPPTNSREHGAGEAITNQPPVTVTTSLNSPTRNQYKKEKPQKSRRPMPNLGQTSLENPQPLSTNQIMSLYGPNDPGMDSSPPKSEQTPETASVRSATFAGPASATVPQIDDPGFFDPFAPPPKVPYFNEEHFGDDSEPMQEETQDPSTSCQGETAPTSTVTTSIAAGGARRKVPRMQSPTLPTQTHLYTGPSTSRRGPPPEPMLLDGSGKWPCPICTFENRISAQYCEVCHDGRPPWYTGETMSPIMSPSVTPSQSEERIVQHGQHEPISKAFVDEWVCQVCTRSNRPSQDACPSCGTQRPTGFAVGSTAGSTEPKRTPSLIPEHEMPSTSQQRLEVPLQIVTRPTTSRQLSENLSSLRTSSVGSATSGSAVRSVTMEQVRKEQEKSALEIFHGIIEYCRQADDKFVDDQFLPSQRSLQFPNASVYDQIIANACWFRPPQINSGDPEDQFRNWSVFCPEGPAATDIQQGILGNCWFLSGLSVLVERPQLLRKIFVTSEYSKYGAYMIRLCKDGVWQTVIIDDLLPCSNRGELLYTQAKRKQLWVPLIEKALAKAHGCYEALQAGRSIEGLATLTGAPCESVQLVAGPDLIEPEPDMIWVRLLSAREAGYLMGASCGGANMDVDETIYNEVDLRVRHAYSVLDVRIEKKDNGEAVKLLQLRNPWAQQSWSGAWSDRDPIWYNNPRMISRLNPNQSNHGIFWLCFDDMLRYFDSVDICKIRDNKWSEIRMEGDFPDSALLPPSSFFLEVFQSTEIDLSIFQQGSRSQEGSGRHPVDLCICVFRSSEHAATSPPGSQVVLGPLVVCSRRQVKRHGSCSHFFEPGIYQVVTLAFNHWMSAFDSGALGIGAALGAAAGPAEHPKFVLALHSSRAISLSQYKAHPMLLADATIELVMKRGEKKDVRECSSCYYLTRGWAGLIVVAENRHPSRYMQIVCDCLDSRNVVSTRGSLKTADCVPPLHKQVIIVLTQLDGHSGFTITHKLVHRMGYQGLGDWSQYPGNHDPPLTPAVEALHQPRPL